MICQSCGKKIDGKSYNGMCQACYKYFRDGGTINTPSEHGKIEYDVNGKVICHICGKAYKRLGTHVKESHGMTIAEYKEEFGLCANAKTTEENYSKMMASYALEHNMDEMLKVVGKNTRIKKGNSMRKNKQARLQEIINKRNRNSSRKSKAI